MYNKNWLEKADPNKRMYFTVLGNKISVCFFTETEAAQYRNRYGSLYEERKYALRELEGN